MDLNSIPQPENNKSHKRIGTDEIVHRHLSDKNDIITDEDIMSVEIGTASDEVSTIGAEAEELFNDDEQSTRNRDSAPTNTWDVKE